MGSFGKAPSGKATCRKCRKLIGQGSVRYADSFPSEEIGGREVTVYYHALCVADLLVPKVVAALEAFEERFPERSEVEALLGMVSRLPSGSLDPVPARGTSGMPRVMILVVGSDERERERTLASIHLSCSDRVWRSSTREYLFVQSHDPAGLRSSHVACPVVGAVLVVPCDSAQRSSVGLVALDVRLAGLPLLIWLVGNATDVPHERDEIEVAIRSEITRVMRGADELPMVHTVDLGTASLKAFGEFLDTNVSGANGGFVPEVEAAAVLADLGERIADETARSVSFQAALSRAFIVAERAATSALPLDIQRTAVRAVAWLTCRGPALSVLLRGLDPSLRAQIREQVLEALHRGEPLDAHLAVAAELAIAGDDSLGPPLLRLFRAHWESDDGPTIDEADRAERLLVAAGSPVLHAAVVAWVRTLDRSSTPRGVALKLLRKIERAAGIKPVRFK